MKLVRRLGAWLAMAVVVAVAVYPLLWMAGTGLREAAAVNRDVWALPTAPTLAHFRAVAANTTFLRSFANSAAVTAVAVLLLTFLASMAGFAFGRCEFRGKRWLWALFLAGLVLPVHVTLIPLQRLEGLLGLTRGWGSLAFLAAVYTAFNMSFSVFFLRGFFANIPQAVVDAAELDGCGAWGLYWRILLPLSRPALVVVGLVNFVMIWNEFIFALVLIQSADHYTLPVAVKNFADDSGMNLPVTCAALTMTVLPVLAVFLAAQRRIIRGLTAGAVRG